MQDFIAIDVETANRYPSSICAIGAVKVRDGLIIDSRYSLVNPEPCWYSRFCTKVHGLTDDDTRNAPSFGTVWSEWSDWFEDLPFVAHNARFDHGCIRAACGVYGLESPDKFYCTLEAARRSIPRAVLPSKSLDSLCDFFGVPLEHHHNALDDAKACAAIALTIL